MPPSTSRRLPAWATHPTLRRSAATLAGAVFAYGVVGFFILPGVIRSQAETIIAEKLQREASIGAVEVNPYALTLTLRDVKVRERKSEEVFASFDLLHVNLSSESLLRLAPVVREVRLSAPYVHLARTAPHRYNIDDIVELASSQPPSDAPARFAVNNIQIDGGRIAFDDRPARASHAVTDIALGIPFVSSLPSQVDIFVEPLLRAKVNGAPFEFKGKARPFADPADAVVDLRLDGLDLTRYIEYLPVKPQARISGAKLDLNLTARFRQGGEGQALLLQGEAALKSLQVADVAGKPVLRLQELAVALNEADVFAGRIDLSRIRLDGLQADVTRAPDGRLNLASLMPPAEPAPAPQKTADKPLALKVMLGELAVRNAALRYADEHSAHPLRASAGKLDLALRKLAIDTGKQSVDIGEITSAGADVLVNRNLPAATGVSRNPEPKQQAAEQGKGYAVNIARAGISNWSFRMEDQGAREPVVTTVSPVNLTMEGLSTEPASRARLDLKAGVNKSGQLAVNGAVGLAPLHADLALDIKAVDILPLQPFITAKVNLRATSANLSSKGRVQLDEDKEGKLRGGFKGDVTVGNLATVDKAGNNDFLRWKSLHAGGVDVRLEPLAVAVDQLALADFFARVIIDPSGRINLQDIVRGDADAGDAPKADNGGRASPMPPVTIKRVSLQGGRVRFTDNFIKPNYSASLSQFGGVVSGLSSDPASRADVDLRGEVNGAPLAVGGRINPLRGDLFLDIKANVRGMELAPLSAYSGKYVGYGIEKGKLSFEVGYQVDNRKLSAENRLVLEQLTFGDKVQSPEATSLPVRFAVALLSDRNGVIDLNLPIAGSLDDPQFSIGAIIFKIIGNTIAKAVTQPFALLGALFGGGAELSNMAFEPGRASIPAAAEEKLRGLAKALAERPGLRLDIGGRVDPEADREGLKHVSVERKVRALKIRDLRAKGVEVEPGSVTVSREEYPGLLLRAYRDEKFPKPRNVIGLPKDLPVEEMEKLMSANADVDEDDLLSLGNQRAQAVKNWLQKNGQVSADRMFIVAAKVDGAAERGKPASRVDFSLK
ncbi:DUF748 domain-containing protein [Noviherbaspirillum sp. ST9]|uniref:DUF748 domain-containing protein n=1 Tax=Noviherbaspirillum sp. ST9 TaxID=3401606 RepID=UPI003B586227